MKQRIEYIDLAKGFCISFVVLLHVYGELSGDVLKIMNLFRMPLYFFLSGLFFKTYDGFPDFLRKKTNKLLIPFFFCLLVTIIPSTILLNSMTQHELTMNDFFWVDNIRFNLGINGASWFLLCLFAVNVYFYIIFLLTKQNIIWISLLSGICGLIGYFLNINDCFLPMWLDTALTAMPFFLIGYLMRRYSNILYSQKSSKDYITGLISLFLLVAIYFFNSWRETGVICFGDNRFDIGVFPLYLGGFCGTYFVLMISKQIEHLPIFSYIGRYSIIVLLTHLLFLFVLRNIIYQLGISQDSVWVNMIVFIFILLLSLPTIWFCKKYLPYFFAQKDLW